MITPEKLKELRRLLEGTGVDVAQYLANIGVTDKEARAAGITYKAVADIDSLLADVRAAYDAGDVRAFDGALRRLAQLRPTSGGRTSDLSARAPIGATGKAVRSFDALMDGVSQQLQKTGGR